MNPFRFLVYAGLLILAVSLQLHGLPLESIFLCLLLALSVLLDVRRNRRIHDLHRKLVRERSKRLLGPSSGPENLPAGIEIHTHAIEIDGPERDQLEAILGNAVRRHIQDEHR